MTASAAKVARRRVANVAFEGFCWAVTAVALVALAAILWSLLSQGLGGRPRRDRRAGWPTPSSARS
jgi:phosphate transport system permease protein